MSGKKLFFFLAFLTLSCAKKTDKETTSSSSSGITANAGSLSVTVSTAWQDTPSEFEAHGTCTASGTATAVDNVTCDVEIPEAQLRFSKLKFDMSRSGDCNLLRFIPYQYRKSSDAAYTPIGGTDPIDCSQESTPDDSLECWGGGAKEIVPSFPQFRFLFTTGLTMEKIISSPNEKLEIGNRYVSNDLANLSSSIAQVSTDPTPSNGVDDRHEGYVGNSMFDYRVECVDKWANPMSTITVNIIDFDGSNPTTNHIRSWQ